MVGIVVRPGSDRPSLRQRDREAQRPPVAAAARAAGGSRRGPHGYPRGSSASRNPSPSRLKPSTVSETASPGKIMSQVASGR